MNPEELAEYREFAADLAREAGELTLTYFRPGIEVETKSDDTPVTIADRRAEELIRKKISERYPSHSILGEEQGFLRGSPSGSVGLTWVIDPIDGTRSYIAQVPLYAVLIALISGTFDGSSAIESHRSLVAAVYAPAVDDMVSAARGLGCTWNGRRASVSEQATIAESRIATTDFADLQRRTPELSSRVGAARFTRTWGDAYGYMMVATGRMDAMIDPIVNPWDIAPLPVIIEEAGGTYSDLAGNSLLSESAIASNGAIHAALIGSSEPSST